MYDLKGCVGSTSERLTQKDIPTSSQSPVHELESSSSGTENDLHDSS